MQILHIDIETAPHIVYTWGLWGQDINPDNVIAPGYTMCWAAKWHGARETMFSSIHEGEFMLEWVHALLEEADAVVHYNGTKFDIPTLNAEFMQCKLRPPSSYTEIDLLKTARKRFRLPSNKLSYVTKVLGLQGKLEHKGMQLWRECMAGNEAAWNTMRRYNIRDVTELERVYERLLPWIERHPNWGHFVNSEAPVCRNCGSTNLVRNGVERKTTVPYQRYRCLRCAAPLRGRLGLRDTLRPSTV